MVTICSGSSPYFGQRLMTAPVRRALLPTRQPAPAPDYQLGPAPDRRQLPPYGDWPRELWAERYGMHGLESAWKVCDCDNFEHMEAVAEAIIQNYSPNPPMLFTRQRHPSGQWMSWYCRDPHGGHAPADEWFQCPFPPLWFSKATKPEALTVRPRLAFGQRLMTAPARRALLPMRQRAPASSYELGPALQPRLLCPQLDAHMPESRRAHFRALMTEGWTADHPHAAPDGRFPGFHLFLWARTYWMDGYPLAANCLAAEACARGIDLTVMRPPPLPPPPAPPGAGPQPPGG